MLFILGNYCGCKNIGIFLEHFALNLLSGKKHDVTVANVTLFYTVMLHAKETYKLERHVDGSLTSKTLSEFFFGFI